MLIQKHAIDATQLAIISHINQGPPVSNALITAVFVIILSALSVITMTITSMIQGHSTVANQCAKAVMLMVLVIYAKMDISFRETMRVSGASSQDVIPATYSEYASHVMMDYS